MGLKTKRKVFAKYGKNITIKESNKVIISFPEYDSLKREKSS